MYTIKEAARLSGIPVTTLRAWERRYAVVTPERNSAGYRLYDKQAIATLLAMRRLVDAGWAPSQAARAAVAEVVTAEPAGRLLLEEAKETRAHSAETCSRALLHAAAVLDLGGIERSVELGFALGGFEEVVDDWLMPTLVALGEGWASGHIDVAGEHAVSHSVQRRLSTAFDAAGRRSRGPRVVVGLPTGSRHELGALAFATAIRRLGHDVLYLGSDVPASSWEAAVRSHAADAAVLAVVTADDREAAQLTARRLVALGPATPQVCVGGKHAPDLLEGAQVLSGGVAQMADVLDDLMYDQQPVVPGGAPLHDQPSPPHGSAPAGN